jgi:hypothetical protein
VDTFSPVIPEGRTLMDNAFRAKYKILQKVYGEYEKDTIIFEVYDHYCFPSFAHYSQVLLYVSRIITGFGIIKNICIQMFTKPLIIDGLGPTSQEITIMNTIKTQQ